MRSINDIPPKSALYDPVPIAQRIERLGESRSAVIAKIRAGIIDGAYEDGDWYVERQVEPQSDPQSHIPKSIPEPHDPGSLVSSAPIFTKRGAAFFIFPILWILFYQAKIFVSVFILDQWDVKFGREGTYFLNQFIGFIFNIIIILAYTIGVFISHRMSNNLSTRLIIYLGLTTTAAYVLIDIAWNALIDHYTPATQVPTVWVLLFLVCVAPGIVFWGLVQIVHKRSSTAA